MYNTMFGDEQILKILGMLRHLLGFFGNLKKLRVF